MWNQKVFLILGCILHGHLVSAIWSCGEDSECSIPSGSVCRFGDCVCPDGRQLVLGGTVCAEAAPYLTSPCIEDHQCSNLLNNFKCVYAVNETVGRCACQPGYHYLIGRCWKSADFRGLCDRNEECFGALRDPNNMVCEEGRCACSPGYYERQRGECRKSGDAVGEGCVLDEDCRFPNGVCDPRTLTCFDRTNPPVISDAVIATIDVDVNSNMTSKSLFRSHGTVCSSNNACPPPFLCSQFGVCVCPRGFYPNPNGATCFAELGTTATEEQCGGFMAEVIDGVCGCPANVYYNETMRDCVKATRRITDACVTDQMCHTFGAASRCGPPDGDNWNFRNCECIPEFAVWDASRGICRLFAGVGENCEVDNDCMAGSQEIRCLENDEGQGICTCPEDTTNIEGFCLTSGLSLGEECQMTQECTETLNTDCIEGRCSCKTGFQERDGICAPTIGSACLLDAECAIENTVCLDHPTDPSTCQCNETFLEFDDACWPELYDHTSECNVTAQCISVLGPGSDCIENQCECAEDFHFRDEGCWPKIGLFSGCSRSSECYLGDLSGRVQCRNSLCQCSFDFPYSEELHTCTGKSGGSSASVAFSSTFTIVIALFYYIMLN